MNKFELTEDSRDHYGVTLWRIRALRDIPRHSVKAGDIGGWVEHDRNLSHDGDSWVGDDAMVSANARIEGNARVAGTARVRDDSVVTGDAHVIGNASVRGRSKIYDSAIVGSNAIVLGTIFIFGDAIVASDAVVKGFGVRIGGDARILSTHHYFTMGPVNPWGDCITLHKTTTGHLVHIGCWEPRRIDEIIPTATVHLKGDPDKYDARHWYALIEPLTDLARSVTQPWDAAAQHSPRR